jgi:hypothetical protein
VKIDVNGIYYGSNTNSNAYNFTLQVNDNLSNTTSSGNLYIVPAQTSIGFGNVILSHNGTAKKGNVLIGGTTNDASALLNVQSTTQGFLPPRGTNTQMLAIASPATGLIFYDTTNNKLNCYDGTTWQACW